MKYIAYHGTNVYFEQFDAKFSGKNYGRAIGYRKGFFFASEPEGADITNFDIDLEGQGRLLTVNLDLEKPLIIEINNNTKIKGHWATFPDPSVYYDNNAKAVNQKARSRKADSVIIRNVETGRTMYIAYKPEQIEIIKNEVVAK